MCGTISGTSRLFKADNNVGIIEKKGDIHVVMTPFVLFFIAHNLKNRLLHGFMRHLAAA